MLISILSWILFGLIVGVIARLLIPGRDPMGWLATIFLGIVGSFLGGLIAYAFGWATEPGQPAGWLLSIVGAILGLLFYYWVAGVKRV